jgi:(4S)-4-hydroxy-5-phosphonooxypentane-2,3-dione isomerase
MYPSDAGNENGEMPMPIFKSITIAFAAIALSAGAWLLLPISSRLAAAQTGPLYINLVELDIVPAEFDKFMEAIKENGAASVKDPGCREFNIIVSEKEPHHVLLFEVYDNAAALEAHRATDHFKKYQATTANMVAKREVRAFASVAMNIK